MEVIAGILEKFGPMGLTIIMLAAGIVYHTRWLRDMQSKGDERHDKIQDRFLTALEDQRKENHAALREVVSEFKGMHEELGEKVDRLAERVDTVWK